MKTRLLLLSGMLLSLTAGAQTITKTSDLMTSLPGWDIYEAGTYRYGPCFIINDDASIDAWFAASGGTYGDTFYNPSSTQSPVQIVTVGSVGEYFVAKEDFYCLSVCCPTWGSTDERVTISVYSWRSTYTSTLRTTPLYTKEIQMTDNMWVNAYYSAEAEQDTSIWFPAGKYLWVLTSPSQHAGAWIYSAKKQGHTCTAYQNGNSVAGSYMMITQGPGGPIYWDAPTYQHSTDGGHTWTTEAVALMPTQGSRDEFSACDPGLFRFGDYYYLGYTSTENPAGIDNHLYMARGTSPTGPWEKWNGHGWGGRQPQPVVEYTGNHSKWGCGEPSMVVMDSTLYLYYTWDDGNVTTRLAKASLADENWPASLESIGTVIDKTAYTASDHCDVKYCDDIKLFLAVHTSKRMTEEAYINVWISPDGQTFQNIGRLEGPTQPGLHNCGISGDEHGHISLARPQFIAYAYGIGSWGQWNTHLQPLQFNEELVTRITALPAGGQGTTTTYNLSGRPTRPGEQGIRIAGRRKVLVR